MLTPKIARLLSLVALAAVAPLLGLYALLMKASMPGADSGIDATSATVALVAFTVLFAALIIVAVNFSIQLAREAKGIRQTP